MPKTTAPATTARRRHEAWFSFSVMKRLTDACVGVKSGPRSGPDMACAWRRAEEISGPPVWIGELTPAVRTGDIVLFSSKHRASDITKLFTNSVWDHVGMVVKPTPNRAYLIEWGGGLFASELTPRLTEYSELDARQIVLRSLNIPHADRRKQEEALERFFDTLFREHLGSNAGVPLGQVARAARRQFLDFRQHDGALPVYDDLTRLFCSKTVAVAYKSIGLLSAARDASDFLPKHFSSRFARFLDLQRGAELGPEMTVTFEPRSLRTAVSALLSLSGFDFLSGSGAQRNGAQRIQRAARRLVARRAVARLRRGEAGRGAIEKRLLPLRLFPCGGRALCGCLAWSEGLNEGHVDRRERTALLKRVSAVRLPRAESVYAYESVYAHAPGKLRTLPPPPLQRSAT
jgi:hypothetical protein